MRLIITSKLHAHTSNIHCRFKGQKTERLQRAHCQKRIAYNRVNIVERIELLLLFVRIWRGTRVERLRRSKKDSGLECYLTYSQSLTAILRHFKSCLGNKLTLFWRQLATGAVNFMSFTGKQMTLWFVSMSDYKYDIIIQFLFPISFSFSCQNPAATSSRVFLNRTRLPVLDR